MSKFYYLVAKIPIFDKLILLSLIYTKMKIPGKIIKYLDSNRIKYQIIEHKTVFTAYDKAATLRIKPSVIGKTLVLKADSWLIMVLVAGNKNLDLAKIKKAVNDFHKKIGEKAVKKIDFISETIIKNKFKGIKLGAIPPFGEIWKLPLFADKGLLKEKNIFISSGVYEASFKVSPKVLEKTGAILGNFSKAR
jgi:Ala-tRNA(Pro) deacylase